jgi:hypothetical protein
MFANKKYLLLCRKNTAKALSGKNSFVNPKICKQKALEKSRAYKNIF